MGRGDILGQGLRRFPEDGLGLSGEGLGPLGAVGHTCPGPPTVSGRVGHTCPGPPAVSGFIQVFTGFVLVFIRFI